MPQAQVEMALSNSDSTIPDLLDAYQDICIQYGYLAAVSGHGIRENAESDLLKTVSLMRLVKERIKRDSKPKN